MRGRVKLDWPPPLHLHSSVGLDRWREYALAFWYHVICGTGWEINTGRSVPTKTFSRFPLFKSNILPLVTYWIRRNPETYSSTEYTGPCFVSIWRPSTPHFKRDGWWRGFYSFLRNGNGAKTAGVGFQSSCATTPFFSRSGVESEKESRATLSLLLVLSDQVIKCDEALV